VIMGHTISRLLATCCEPAAQTLDPATVPNLPRMEVAVLPARQPSRTVCRPPPRQVRANPMPDRTTDAAGKLPMLPALSDVAARLPYAIAGRSANRVRLFRPKEAATAPLMVKPSTLRHLTLAQRVIDKFSRQKGAGMGNQMSDIVASNGESWARLSKLTAWYKDHYGGNVTLDARIRAEAALQFNGFNCINVSAVAFVELIAAGVDAPIVLIAGDGHSYVVINDPADHRNREEDIVVVDLWARFPMAHTLKTARFKCPVKRSDETLSDYGRRFRDGEWSRLQAWQPGDASYLAGHDLSSTPKRFSHEGFPFHQESAQAGGTPHEVFIVEDEVECTTDAPSLDTPVADLAPFDPRAYIEEWFGAGDPLPSIFSQPVFVQGHVVSEWLFSTEQAGLAYKTDDQQEPVAFNEFAKDDWLEWQNAISRCRSGSLISLMPPEKAEWVDLPDQI